MATSKVIDVKGDFTYKEMIASGAISPGHLEERTSTANTVKVHATQGGFAQKAFAIQSAYTGDDYTTAYATATQVEVAFPAPGAEVMAIIANGSAIAIGDKLVSAGDGTLKELTSETKDETVVAVAVEACDMSGSSAADPDGYCIVEIV